MQPPPQTSRYQPGYDCPLPADALSELLGNPPRRTQRATERPPTAWRRFLHLLAWLAVPVVLVAFLGAILTGLHDKPATQPSTPVQAPSAQPISQPPLQQQASQPPRLVWEWVRSEAYGPVWVQCYETCTPARGGLIVRDPAPHAQLVRDPVPRAELVSMPVRRATLVNN